MRIWTFSNQIYFALSHCFCEQKQNSKICFLLIMFIGCMIVLLKVFSPGKRHKSTLSGWWLLVAEPLLSTVPDISSVALKLIANIATNRSAKASETRK